MMEMDTGASLSIINELVFNKLQDNDNRLTLNDTSVKFRTYNNNSIKPLGAIDVLVEYKSQSLKHPVFVVKGEAP